MVDNDMFFFAMEVTYIGTHYAGLQYQKNTPHTIQGILEKAFLQILPKIKAPLELTCSSRTDKGVHALQNFFHFQLPIDLKKKCIKQLNCILPHDIAVVNIYKTNAHFHARYSAQQREYQYFIHYSKNPFLNDRSYFYQKPIKQDVLIQLAERIKTNNDFVAFSKKHSQNPTTLCNIYESRWQFEKDSCSYTVKANRFLRGMVKALVSTMLLVNKGLITLEEFEQIFTHPSFHSKVVFDVPSCGLVLNKVVYPESVFLQPLD